MTGTSPPGFNAAASPNAFTVDKTGLQIWLNAQKQYHRADGPALEHANGTTEWYCNGLRHRLDGPAVERASGMNEWWIDGRQLTPEETDAQKKLLHRQQELIAHQERMKRLDRLTAARPRRKP